jgi:hypothetical protein
MGKISFARHRTQPFVVRHVLPLKHPSRQRGGKKPVNGAKEVGQ